MQNLPILLIFHNISPYYLNNFLENIARCGIFLGIGIICYCLNIFVVKIKNCSKLFQFIW